MCTVSDRACDIIVIRISITSSLWQLKIYYIRCACGKLERQREREREEENWSRDRKKERKGQSRIRRKKWVTARYLHESRRCNIPRNPMPEGRRRRCPNVINIFRARRVEKDCLPSSFLHPPRLVLFSPGPNFLADAPSAEGTAADFQSAFLFHLFPFASSLCTNHHHRPLPLLLSVKAHGWILSGHIERKV